jgi:hypothetical protein
VNVLYHGEENVGIALRRDAVAEVEDVSGVSGIRGKYFVGRGKCGITSGENGGGVEVALQNDVAADTSADVVETHRLIDAQHRCTRCVHRLEKVRATDSEVNTRDIGMKTE